MPSGGSDERLLYSLNRRFDAEDAIVSLEVREEDEGQSRRLEKISSTEKGPWCGRSNKAMLQ